MTTLPVASNEILAATCTAPRRSSHEVAFTELSVTGSEKVTETEAEMGTFVAFAVGFTDETTGGVVSTYEAVVKEEINSAESAVPLVFFTEVRTFVVYTLE